VIRAEEVRQHDAVVRECRVGSSVAKEADDGEVARPAWGRIRVAEDDHLPIGADEQPEPGISTAEVERGDPVAAAERGVEVARDRARDRRGGE
jgi:hypothetical protein